MSQTHKRDVSRLLDPNNGSLKGQERVNAEIFTAMEILGRKLARSEAERERLTKRLAQIEAGVSVDEKTGKVYLPVALANKELNGTSALSSSKWILGASLFSSLIAFMALGVVLLKEPAQPSLTKAQLAALDSLIVPRFALSSPRNKNWTDLDSLPRHARRGENEEFALSRMRDLPTPAFEEDIAKVEPSFKVEDFIESVPEAELEPVVSEKDVFEVVEKAEPQLPVKTKEKEIVEVQLKEPVKKDVVLAAKLPEIKKQVVVEKPAVQPKLVEKAVLPKKNVLATQESETVLKEKEIVEVAVASKNVVQKTLTQEEVKVQAAPKIQEVAKIQELENKEIQKPVVLARSLINDIEQETSFAQKDATLPENVKDLERRALQDVPEAQHDLATIYASGDLVKRDYARAVYWFKKAAVGGVANAHYNLGVIYQQGLNVKADINEAIKWYKQAAELGHPEAMYNLGISYIEGVGTKSDVKKSVSYFRRAAEAGVVQAAYNLAVLYESNFIGKIDTVEALRWYETAAKAGHKEAQSAVIRLKGASQEDRVSGVAETDTLFSVKGYGSSPVDTGGRARAPAFKDALLARIQVELIKRGLLSGEADGVMTMQTEDAIRSYQREFTLPEDGQPSKKLLEKITQSKI